MKIDHLVVNIDKKYQEDQKIIEGIRDTKLVYEPKWGKGTNGFKASNIWIGKEYFELINLLKTDGGGWVPEWTNLYNNGHRGLICLMLDVEDIDILYDEIRKKGIEITEPKWLEFKWFFNLFTRRMPWKNNYLPFFEKVPLQIGFQQMKDEKARKQMEAYMQPNSSEAGISGIEEILIYGDFTDQDFLLLQTVFNESVQEITNGIVLNLSDAQSVSFIKSSTYKVTVNTISDLELTTTIENIAINT